MLQHPDQLPLGSVIIRTGSLGCCCFSLSSVKVLRSRYHLLDIVFVGKKDDDSRIRVFSQASDDLVELPLFGLPGNLDRLGDAHSP